jgi:(p)ppGpp synthase/HD superfamily hydrolase
VNKDVAKQIAIWAHAGQKDKAGVDYIHHVERVAAKVAGDDVAETVAWLHDVVEDNHFVSLGDLNTEFPGVVVRAVGAITRRTGEKYFDYIRRVALDPLAAKVKIADLQDHLDHATFINDSMVERYEKALEMLGGSR